MIRSQYVKWIALLSLIAAVAVLSGWIAFCLFIRPQLVRESVHETLVQQLQLTPEQQRKVEAIDRQFEEERAVILRRFEQSIRHLASLLEKESAYNVEVEEAIEALHQAHGDLQALSIRRYFAILQELPPDKQLELRRLASQALSRPE